MLNTGLPTKPDNFRAANITNSTILLTWNQGLRYPKLRYIINIHDLKIGKKWTQVCVRMTSCLVTSLKSNRTYEFVVYGKNSVGESEGSLPVTASTMSEVEEQIEEYESKNSEVYEGFDSIN